MDSIVGHLKPDPEICHEQFKVSCQGSIAGTCVHACIDSVYIWEGSRGVPIFNPHDTTGNQLMFRSLILFYPQVSPTHNMPNPNPNLFYP